MGKFCKCMQPVKCSIKMKQERKMLPNENIYRQVVIFHSLTLVIEYDTGAWVHRHVFRPFNYIGVGRGGGGRGGGAGRPNNLRGGANIPFGPPNNPPTCTGKTIPLNSILEFSLISYFKMRNVIIWHWFIKNLVGTRRRNDVDATSLRRIDVVTTSCACWEYGPPKF